MPTRKSLFLILLLGLVAPLVVQAVEPGIFRIHLYRADDDYENWGIHAWGPDLRLKQPTTWTRPLAPSGQDEYGIYWDLPIKTAATEVFFIIHRGDEKNNPSDNAAKFKQTGREIWMKNDDDTLYISKPNVPVSRFIPSKPAVDPDQASPVADPKPAKPAATPVPAAQNSAGTAPVQPAKPTAPPTPVTTDETRKLQDEITSLKTDLKASQDRYSLALRNAVPIWIPLTSGGLLLVALVLFLFTLLRNNRLRKELKVQKAALATVSEEAMKTAESKLMHKTLLDELTGLPNRAGLNQALPLALNKAKRYQRQLALLFIDLDQFKPINDNFGHEAGDFVLRTIAERFKEGLRTSDMIARLGGDEFVVLIEEMVDPKFVADVAQKLLTAAQQGFLIGGQELHVSASIGIATYPSDGKNAALLLRNADAAMYKAKENGKNNFQYYSEDLNTHSLQRLALESSLRHALTRGELTLHYQPVVETKHNQVVSVEALLRWKHADMGYITPAQFIPLAEENNLIDEIGQWVLHEALTQAKTWFDAGHELTLSLNISPRQLKNEDFHKTVSRALVESGFPAEKVILEFTESFLLGQPDEAIVMLENLKELGLKLALDDFGTGNSSVTALKKFPIDIVKIDRTFLQGIPDDEDSDALVSALISLGQKLRLQVVAEGVETEDQRRFLSSQNCDLYQGFLFAKPAEAKALADKLPRRAK